MKSLTSFLVLICLFQPMIGKAFVLMPQPIEKGGNRMNTASKIPFGDFQTNKRLGNRFPGFRLWGKLKKTSRKAFSSTAKSPQSNSLGFSITAAVLAVLLILSLFFSNILFPFLSFFFAQGAITFGIIGWKIEKNNPFAPFGVILSAFFLAFLLGLVIVTKLFQ